MNLGKIDTKSLLRELVERKVLSPEEAFKILHETKTDLQEEADKWIANHALMYEYMEKAALKLLKENQFFGPRLLSEEARCFSKINNQKFKIANALVSYVIKRIIDKYPSIANLVKFRKVKTK